MRFAASAFIQLVAVHLLLPIGLPAGPLPAQSVSAKRAPSAMFIELGESKELPKLTAPASGVTFDIDGDGDLEQVAWTERNANVALMVMDVDGDGRIASGRELFGSHMVPEAGNGPNALLHLFEASGAPISGAVQSGHRLYEQILLWVDADHDGISRRSELRKAKELFTAIGLGFVRQSREDEHGNRTRFRGWVELRTAGPEQGRADSARDHQARLRFYYELVLGVQ